MRILTMSHEEGLDDSLTQLNACNQVTSVVKSSFTRFIQHIRGERIKKCLLPDPSYFGHFDLFCHAKKAFQEERPDIIVTFGQPMSTHLVGRKLKKLYPSLKWVAHFSDPWVDNLYNDYNWWTHFINQHFQDQVFVNADKLLFTSQETIDLVTMPYFKKICNKADVLPHCFAEKLHQLPIKKTKRNQLLIRYVGQFYGNRQPDPLLKALQKIPQNMLNKIRVEFVGSSTASLQERINHAELEKVVYPMPSVSYLRSLKLMNESDILLNIDAPVDSSPFLPSKLIDYIGANKPIFGITPPGAASKLLRDLKCPVSSPDNPDEIADKLEKLISFLLEGKKITLPEMIRGEYTQRHVGERAYTLFSRY